MLRLALVFVSLAVLTGCYTVSVDYTPTAVLSDALSAPSVRVEIVDARPEDQGLNDPAIIGQYRGGFGIPHAVENGADGVMPATVMAVTADALAAAGVATAADAEPALIATVEQYWADGMVGYGAWVTVNYRLESSGWEASVEGEGGASGYFSNEKALVEQAVEAALVDLAEKSRALFSGEDFQAALRGE